MSELSQGSAGISQKHALPASSAMPLMTEAERQQVLVEWNQTTRPYPHDRCLHELIEQQVERSPDAVALVSHERRLTYRELNHQANQLAHHLRALGVGPETLVGVAAERSVTTVVALLAVLKAGGAYVPLDPTYPPERLRFLLEDSQAPVLITRQALHNRLPVEDRSVVLLDEDWAQIATLPDSNPVPLATSDNLAYVIYTSGSTGKPKGVLVPHRQIVQVTSFQFAYDPPSVFLLLLSFSFDAAGVGIYWTLCQGGRLVIPTDEEMQDMRLLRNLIEQHQVSHTDCAPSLYGLILEAGTASLDSMRYAIVGGEACSPQLVAQHYHALPWAVLVNHYGPTEATILGTRFVCREEQSRAASVPTGRPISNARIYLLDQQFNPVPVGTPGELYIGGAGVTRGYLRRPDLTAERFVPDPFASEPGGRLYRTGDLARYLPDGNIDFLGRVDYQVKVRGYRIELGEIEAALLSHPAIAAAAVEALEHVPGDKRLVAYIVGRGDTAPAREELMAFLEEQLPSYMVPRLFLFLDKMPRTVTGKIDRQALPKPEVRPAEAERAYVGPRTPLEAAIAQVFAVVLGVERVGIHDNFFDLGGNSLRVAQVVLHVASQYGVNPPVVQLFALPTAAGVAQAIATCQRADHSDATMEWDIARLEAEVVLDPAITAEGLPMANILDPSHIFLTGATGYLGVFVLEGLLRKTPADIYCLVRASSPEAGMERIKQKMRFYRIWDDAFSARIHAVPGDLAKPLLGLSPSQFAELAATIEVIYHCGALVNFVYPYSTLKGPNVLGTQEVLRLACQVQTKAVHYVSTIDVLLATRVSPPFLEEEQLDNPRRVPDGYARSKWVAERIVTLARSRGVPACIYRPEMMLSHTGTGATQMSDYFLVEIKGFLQLGILPETPLMLNVVPIDYAAQALVHLSRQEESLGKNFHLWNVQSFSVDQAYDWLRSFGYQFDIVPFSSVPQRLVTIKPSHPLFPVIPLLDGEQVPPSAVARIQGDLDPQIECRNTLKGLEGSGILCPPMNEELAHRCFSYLVDVGFFDPPDELRVAEVATRGLQS